MTQFTCKGVKQINNRISFKHLYNSYLSVFFISAGVPNGEFPEILIAKCRSRFYCTWNFCWGEIVREEKMCAGDYCLPRMRPSLMRRRRFPQKGGGLTGMNCQFSSVFNKDEQCDSIPNKGPSPFNDMPAIKMGLEGVYKILNDFKFTRPQGQTKYLAVF